jgi:hypothetical protein
MRSSFRPESAGESESLTDGECFAKARRDKTAEPSVAQVADVRFGSKRLRSLAANVGFVPGKTGRQEQ